MTGDTHLAPVLDATLADLALADELRRELTGRPKRRSSTTRASTGVNPGPPADRGRIRRFPCRRCPRCASDGFDDRHCETRLGASVATGAVAGWIAHRIVRRLAARGVIRVAARGLLATVPLVGGAVAIGADQAMLMAEEHRNRDAFRARIVAAIEAQRTELHRLILNPSD
jgi:hypothetical protein